MQKGDPKLTQWHAGCLSAKGGLMMGIIGGNSLQPARENHHFYIRKIKNSKVHKLTGSLKRIKILGRRKSEKRFKSI